METVHFTDEVVEALRGQSARVPRGTETARPTLTSGQERGVERCTTCCARAWTPAHLEPPTLSSPRDLCLLVWSSAQPHRASRSWDPCHLEETSKRMQRGELRLL